MLLRHLFIVSVCAALGAASFGCGRPSAGSVVAGDTSQLRRGDLVERILLTGELDTRKGEIIAVPPLPSWQTTIQWLADDGSALAKGAKVVELDTSAVTSNLDDKRTTLREAEHKLAQQLASLRATLAEKEFDVEKWRNDLAKAEIKAAIPSDLIPEREVQERDLELKRCRKELAKAEEVLRAARVGADAEQRNLEIALSTARQEIVRAESALRVLTLTAPADGTVIFLDHPWEGRKMQVGDRVWVGLPIAKIPDLSTLEVVANLWDVDDGRVSAGDRATVAIDAYPERSFSGRIVSVAPVAQEGARQTLRRAFRTVISLEKTDAERMRPGLSTKVVIEKQVASNALLVPRHVIKRRDGSAFVRTTAGERQVVIGRCNARDCAVLKGLSERDRLAKEEER